MSPEAKITGDQVLRIEHWIKSKPEATACGDYSNRAPGWGVSVYVVDNEPLVLYTETGSILSNKVKTGTLLCSEKQAQELQKEGIITSDDFKNSKPRFLKNKEKK